MQIPLESQIPVLGIPPSHIFQPGCYDVGIYELFVLQNDAGFQLDVVWKSGTALIGPNIFFAFVEWRHGRSRTGETAYMRDIKEYTVAFGDPLYFAAVLSLQTQIDDCLLYTSDAADE